MVYLVKNPDSADYISKKLNPDNFQNSLMRRYYEYFSERIKNGFDPLNNITADFTEDERNHFYKMYHERQMINETKAALDEYINIIIYESQKPQGKDYAEMSDEDMLNRLNKIREKKG